MLSLFYKMKNGKRGQLASVMTVLLVVFLIFAFVSVNLGKLGLQRTRMSNAADAASLAAGSAASQLLNNMAGINDLMMLNFSAFIVQVQLEIIFFVIDFALAIVYLILSFVMHFVPSSADVARFMGDAGNYFYNLFMDATTISLTVCGARKVGDALNKRMNELNPDLPKNTRNTARQYAFSNAGIDEPKIDYDDWLIKYGRVDSDAAWQEYRDSDAAETPFGWFMRTLSNRNDKNNTGGYPPYDGNFNANNLLSFDWVDQRRGQMVNNIVDVYTTPMKQLSLEDIHFQDIAKDSGLRSELKDYMYQVDIGWALRDFANLGITMSPLIDAFFEQLPVMIIMLGVVYHIIVVLFFVFVIVWAILCAIPYTSGYGCPRETAIWCMASGMGMYNLFTCGGFLIMATAVILATEINPQDVVCLVYGSDSNDLTLSSEIKRRTEKVGGGDLDYGLWKMQYPEVTSYSRALVEGEGGGRLFPPVQDYNAKIIQAR